ncbi:MAG TPA: hypothetical protein VEW11_07145 [Gaiellaceae bacterium]|nr:hypothetical protein [Gaiellaceae bacterium]
MAVLALTAATSSPALAESGVPDMPIPSVPDLAEVTTAVFEEGELDELDSLTVVDPSITLPAVPAQTTAAEPVPGGAVAAPPPEPAVEAPAEAEPAVNPTPDAPPAPDVAQTAPTNVNVSVRVNSPGDNGSVEQVNVAVATGADGAAETAPQYQPEASQYQAPIPTADTPPADSAPQPPSAEPAEPTDGWNWNWEWNCGDAIPEIPIPQEVGTQNWIWNWDRNCGASEPLPTNTAGENTRQYQPSVTQYRPININISIRINSPGNDGPVAQTNVAVVVTAPALPKIRIEVPAPPAAHPGGAAPPGGAAVAAETITPLTFMAELIEDVFGAPAETPADERDDDECCPLGEPRGVASASAEPQSLLLPQAPPAIRRDITAEERFRASVAVTVRLAKASEARARVARPAPKPAQLRPAPRHSSAPAREQAAVRRAAGFAPVNASDGHLGYFMLAIVGIAFAFAFADATRSVAAEARARGEDPDPPPTRPG